MCLQKYKICGISDIRPTIWGILSIVYVNMSCKLLASSTRRGGKVLSTGKVLRAKTGFRGCVFGCPDYFSGTWRRMRFRNGGRTGLALFCCRALLPLKQCLRGAGIFLSLLSSPHAALFVLHRPGCGKSNFSAGVSRPASVRRREVCPCKDRFRYRT